MESIVDKYKEISIDLLDILKMPTIDNDKIERYLEERQELIQNLEINDNLDEFRKLYKKFLYNIDQEIKDLMEVNIQKAKNEITDYKKQKKANFAYVNNNKINLNIFSKKV